jgi:hypothetical protein
MLPLFFVFIYVITRSFLNALCHPTPMHVCYPYFTLFSHFFTLLILFIELYHLLMLNANIFIIPFFHSRPPKGTLFLLGSHIGSQLLFVFLPFHYYFFMLYLHTLICYSTTFYLFWSSYEYSWMHYVILLLCIHYIFLLSCTDSSYYYAKNISMHWFALLLC